MFRNVDVFAAVVTVLTGVVLAALIWVFVMFALYRKCPPAPELPHTDDLSLKFSRNVRNNPFKK